MVDENKKADERARQLGRLWWLVDTPQFVDRTLVARLHDAIVWPELADEEVETKKLDKVRTYFEGGAKLDVEADVSAPGFLKNFLPRVQANVGLDGRGQREGLDEKFEGRTGKIIRTPERLLNEIVLEYLKNYPNRILFVEYPGKGYFDLQGPLDAARIAKLLDSPPRPLVFANISPGAVILPTMAEREEGGFLPIFREIEEKLFGEGKAPIYPLEGEDNADKKRQDYWNAHVEKYQPRVAMEALEHKCEEGRIGWIDFALASKGSEMMHLHVVPAGQYYAGTFGFNFVQRGYRYGCRIVGSLKAGNDLNVMAIYER